MSDRQALDSELKTFFDARESAIAEVIAHRAPPPEYPGLALVPVEAIKRLATFAGPPRRIEAAPALLDRSRDCDVVPGSLGHSSIPWCRAHNRYASTCEAVAETILAIEAEAATLDRERAGSLDAAWAAVEAVLPDGWERLRLERHRPMRHIYTASVHDGTGGAMAIRTGVAVGAGPTPPAALHALAARLAEKETT